MPADPLLPPPSDPVSVMEEGEGTEGGLLSGPSSLTAVEEGTAGALLSGPCSAGVASGEAGPEGVASDELEEEEADEEVKADLRALAAE